ncbi:hypothetical protein PR048_017959 [Dryococelus australis]|uniref:Uncharacterized protein n=1 Tax=Dryococelus australis TaxID=614101 RepID=A0ABQ9HB13_9NEOP|nr:hypothetical protein PR048_017959 [Dryococelus australis]
MRAIVVRMEQHRNERAGETGDPRENPPTNGIVRHDSHMRKSGVTRPEIEPGSPSRRYGLHSCRRRDPGCSGVENLADVAVSEAHFSSLFREDGSDGLRVKRFGRLLTSRSREPMRAIVVRMEQHRNERAGETGDPRENPPTNGIVRHDSHMRKSGVTRPEIEPGSPCWWEASRLTRQPTPIMHVATSQ